MCHLHQRLRTGCQATCRGASPSPSPPDSMPVHMQHDRGSPQVLHRKNTCRPPHLQQLTQHDGVRLQDRRLLFGADQREQHKKHDEFHQTIRFIKLDEARTPLESTAEIFSFGGGGKVKESCSAHVHWARCWRRKGESVGKLMRAGPPGLI